MSFNRYLVILGNEVDKEKDILVTLSIIFFLEMIRIGFACNYRHFNSLLMSFCLVFKFFLS